MCLKCSYVFLNVREKKKGEEEGRQGGKEDVYKLRICQLGHDFAPGNTVVVLWGSDVEEPAVSPAL